MKHQKDNWKIIPAFILIILGIAFRTIWHTGENIEFVTAGSFLAGAYLGLRWSVIVPLVTMILSDFIIGNTNIFIFTWSAYFVIGILGYLTLRKTKGKIIQATGLGIVASLWFYLWTNFGVWILDSWGTYPKTMMGLTQAYYYGLPFLKMNVLGNLLFIPSSFFLIEKVKSYHFGFIKKLII